VLVRVVAFAAVLAAAAVLAPRVAPEMLSAFVGRQADSLAATPAGPPPPSRVADGESDAGDHAPAGRRIALRADGRGHFLANAVVNGRSIDVIVDTGATAVALSESTARRLGVFVPRSAYTRRISTANGVVMAAAVTLQEVRVGGISVRGVEAVVVPGDALPVSLLGMSFLTRLSKFELAGDQLVLTQ
jgi:aspartyl protease family protein